MEDLREQLLRLVEAELRAAREMNLCAKSNLRDPLNAVSDAIAGILTDMVRTASLGSLDRMVQHHKLAEALETLNDAVAADKEI